MNLFQNDSAALPFAPGQTVFRSGDAPGAQMFAVAEGEIDIQVDGITIETVTAGGVFGELGLIEDQPRSATAMARVPSRVVAINERRFSFLVQQNPFFALHVMRAMAHRIRRLSRRP